MTTADVARKPVALKPKDFESDQDVRWCPGCGDYAILKAVQSILPELGIPRERFVVVSGIGCSSRFPYYMSTYGFHTIHGRGAAIATGLKLTRPELQVWCVTGDGDALSIGGNHLIHALRRNVGLKILLFNNRIYGLTKGQYSPTSEVGKRTSSTPFGSVDNPFNPMALAIGAGATFAARSVDIFQAHLKETLRQAAAHEGTAFVEIYQNCNIFNDLAFSYMTAKENRALNVLYLEHGKPLVFGAETGRKGIVQHGLGFEVVDLGDGSASVEHCVVWDEAVPNPALAFMMAHVTPPDFPTPIGILRRVETPSFEQGVVDQIRSAVDERGDGSLHDLLHSGDVWTVSGGEEAAG